MEKFKDLRIVDNFYQTSAFFPMPTILASTVSESGQTNLGAYSLCFPYYIAGKDYYAMILECRNSSNTAQNILRTKKVTLNFITDERKYFKEAVRLGFPGDTTEEKMKDCIFTLEKSTLGDDRPELVSEAFQVFECTWDDSLEDAFNDKPGNLEGYEPPFRNFNGIPVAFGKQTETVFFTCQHTFFQILPVIHTAFIIDILGYISHDGKEAFRKNRS